jgi:hypothetical protein
MSQDAPLHNVPTIYVIAADGTQFRCTVQRQDAEASSAPLRWKVTDANGIEYVGPPYTGAQSREDARRLVTEWWGAMKTLERAWSGEHARVDD